MVSLDLDVSRSEAVCGVFEWLPMTVVVPTSWHACGTSAEWSEETAPPLMTTAFRSFWHGYGSGMDAGIRDGRQLTVGSYGLIAALRSRVH